MRECNEIKNDVVCDILLNSSEALFVNKIFISWVNIVPRSRLIVYNISISLVNKLHVLALWRKVSRYYGTLSNIASLKIKSKQPLVF